MSLPAADGLAVLYVLADEWMMRRAQLQAAGVEEPDRLDMLLDEVSAGSRARNTRRDPAARRAEIEAFVADTGGEVTGG